MTLAEVLITAGGEIALAASAGFIAYGRMVAQLQAVKERVDAVDTLALNTRMTALEIRVQGGIEQMLLRMDHFRELLEERAKDYAPEARVDLIDHNINVLTADFNVLYKYSHEARHELATMTHKFIAETEVRLAKIESGCAFRHQLP